VVLAAELFRDDDDAMCSRGGRSIEVRYSDHIVARALLGCLKLS